MTLRRKIILLVAILLVLAGFTGWRFFASSDRPGPVSSLRMQQDEEITPLDTPTDLPPTPTETLLPAQELPTPESTLPTIESWIGEPTYLAESQPGFFFRLDYDTSLWALTLDEMGVPALFHRDISYCKIAPATGRGAPRGYTIDNQFRDIGALRFDVTTVSQDGVVQFVNYFGGDAQVKTGFQVSFQEQQEACLQAAETVLAGLTSVLAPTATPTPTETPTETPTGTPTETYTPTP
jgi:hypothetical protein